MGRKFITIFLLISLLASSISHAQTQNPYTNFNPEELKKNKDYVKNFNSGSYDSKILYNCMMDMLNSARKQYSFTYAFLHDARLDSAAQMQAHFQAAKEERTDLNNSPYKTTGDRLKKFGLTSNGTEVTSKAKAYKAVEEYSYYDICMELITYILKNIKTAEVLLDKRFTYVGFACESDQYRKSVYASIVLANDLVFSDKDPDISNKDLPYQKGRAGLAKFDAKACQRYLDDNSLEKLTDYIKIEGDEVTLATDNHRDIRKMIGREGDAIILDFVKYSSYECNENIKDNNYIHRGFISKPITYQKMLEGNEETEKRSNKMSVTIAKIPDVIDIYESFDMNILVIKDKNIPCRTLFKKNIEVKNWDYNEKINLMKDVTSIKSAGDWVLTEEEGVIEFIIPLPLDKTVFTQEDIEVAMKKLNVYPQYKIQKVDIVSYHSLNHAEDHVQLASQKKRTEAMAKTLAQKLRVPAITNITYQDSWDDFKRDVLEHHFHYDLILGTKEEAISKLKANRGSIAKELEEDYLRHHRYARIIMHVTYPINGKLEYEFVLYKFKKAIEEKNMAFAMSIQKYVMDKVEQGQGQYASLPDRMQVPEEKEYQPFLINKLYMQYWLSEEMSDKIAEDAQKIFNLNNNDISYFNLCVTKVNRAKFKTIADINKLQLEITKLSSMLQIPKDAANNLNLELQFKIITFIKSQPFSTELETLLASTYVKIKSITDPKTLSWRNAYKLVYYFTLNYDYRYAIDLMNPFIGDEDVTIDFILAYISIASTQEKAFMSNLFTKAVTRAAEKSPTGLCGLFKKLHISLFDNKEAQKTICKTCNL